MGPGSSSGVKGPDARLIELPETTVRKDIEINMPESLIDSIDNMEPNALVKICIRDRLLRVRLELSDIFLTSFVILKESGMSSTSDRVSLLSSSSERSEGSESSRADNSDMEEIENVGRIRMERIIEVREDPPEELAESSWQGKAGLLRVRLELSDIFLTSFVILKESGMSSTSDRVSLLSSSSERSEGSESSRADNSDMEEIENVGRIRMERIIEVREDPPEELAESSWQGKAGLLRVRLELSDIFLTSFVILKESGMSSTSDRVSLLSSSSERSEGSESSRADNSDMEEIENVGRIRMERIIEVREDPPEELAESSWQGKAG
ncbi:hypothetical protein DEO72_LG9g1307 [Vigna unguiculata]|uniref:Uncharacterized protein n=1 Tax=Vigna unguiculata TaxID=3917 RepID=A0A4D6MXX3_VIGUN|nr:hypothetical protein DEO72_LG9g1307 [Vigna unguiculata]